MPKFNVKIMQVFTTERVIKIEVEADDLESAVENVKSGSVDIPSFEDERWKESWELEHESVGAA